MIEESYRERLTTKNIYLDQYFKIKWICTHESSILVPGIEVPPQPNIQ